MGCSVSRLELRGRGREASFRSFKHKIVDDAPKSDRATLTNHSSGSASAKLLVKESIACNGRNSVPFANKDIVLGGARELLIPQPQSLRDSIVKEYTNPALLDGYAATKKLDCGKNENDEELEEGEGTVPDFDGPLWMASPSFKEYCVAVADCDSEDDSVKGISAPVADDDPEDTSNMSLTKNLTQRSNDIEIMHDDDDDLIQRDDSPGRSVKRNRRSLRKVLTMRGAGGVRNLFNVTTCYNPLVPSGHNASRKSHGKSV